MRKESRLKHLFLSLAVIGSSAFLATAASADETAGVGYVLYKALTRPSEAPMNTILFCSSLANPGELYSFEPNSSGQFSVYSKIEKNGACSGESIEQVLSRHPCLGKPLQKALVKAAQLNQQMVDSIPATEQVPTIAVLFRTHGFARVTVISTNPRLQVARNSLASRISRAAENLRIVTPTCQFKVEIRSGIRETGKVLEQIQF